MKSSALYGLILGILGTSLPAVGFAQTPSGDPTICAKETRHVDRLLKHQASLKQDFDDVGDSIVSQLFVTGTVSGAGGLGLVAVTEDVAEGVGGGVVTVAWILRSLISHTVPDRYLIEGLPGFDEQSFRFRKATSLAAVEELRAELRRKNNLYLRDLDETSYLKVWLSLKEKSSEAIATLAYFIDSEIQLDEAAIRLVVREKRSRGCAIRAQEVYYEWNNS